LESSAVLRRFLWSVYARPVPLPREARSVPRQRPATGPQLPRIDGSGLITDAKDDVAIPGLRGWRQGTPTELNSTSEGPEVDALACVTAVQSPEATHRKVIISIVGALAVTAILVYVLDGRRHAFIHALTSAPLWMVGIAVGLQIVALLSRTEAWLISVHAAGATVRRRVLFRAAGVGYLASVINGSVGMAARITSLRRSAPDTTPRVPALLAAEIPIITVEICLAAIFSFTLVSPLGVPWWVPVIAITVMCAAVFGLRRLSHNRREGLWAGLAVIRHKSGGRLVFLTVLAVVAQVARNWLMLHAIGEDVSFFDAMALLIAMFTLGQLPVGPSIGPAAAVLILGSHGVADSAAAGVLLAVTGTIGSLGYTSWAIGDRLFAGRFERRARRAETAGTPGSISRLSQPLN
jgi:uncharacterized membrane protein YbhN (UPF0104 family)